MEIGNTIRNLRTESGMSQEELAEKVFVSRQTISNWENDKFYPDVQSLAITRCAAAHSCSLHSGTRSR